MNIGFPPKDPQVYELYWSPPQVMARGHPNMLTAQKFLLNLWHTSDPNTPISLSQPIVYADRVRIRQPGDSIFALGPHADGGSVERWEPNGYGINGVYDSIFRGKWEEFDPFESSPRAATVSDLYHSGGSCSMFRMFQAWLSMSHTAPGEGTLKVNPLIQLTTAYFLLRPFFEPIKELPEGKEDQYTEEFLAPENWRLIPTERMTTALHGATPSRGQEMTEKLHPHLDLKNTMVHIPKIKPGDYVAWHCDSRFFQSPYLFRLSLWLSSMLTIHLSDPLRRQSPRRHVRQFRSIHPRLSPHPHQRGGPRPPTRNLPRRCSRPGFSRRKG